MEMDVIDDGSASELALPLKILPSATSLAALLTQSLLANDKGLFESVLRLQNENFDETQIISNTLSRIDTPIAILLLEKLSIKFRLKPRDSMHVMKWLVPLLAKHDLKSRPCRAHLARIRQSIDYHCQGMLPALKLQGRLALVMAKAKSHAHQKTTKNEVRVRTEKTPLFFYN